MIYVTFLAVSISFFDAQTPVLSSRIILPILLPLTISLISLAYSWIKVFNRRLILYGLLLLLFLFVSINANYTVSKIREIHSIGIGYTSLNWQQSEIIDYLAKNSDTRKIYSNGPDVIHFLTGKQTAMLPKEASPNTLILNEDFEQEMAQMLQECREGRAYIAYLDKITWRWYLPTAGEVESIQNIRILKRKQDGVIYRAS